MKKVYISYTGSKLDLVEIQHNLEVAYREEIEFRSHEPGTEYDPDILINSDAVIFYKDYDVPLIGKGMHDQMIYSHDVKKPCYILINVKGNLHFGKIYEANLTIVDPNDWKNYARLHFDAKVYFRVPRDSFFPVNFISQKFLKDLNPRTNESKELSDLLIKIL